MLPPVTSSILHSTKCKAVGGCRLPARAACLLRQCEALTNLRATAHRTNQRSLLQRRLEFGTQSASWAQGSRSPGGGVVAAAQGHHPRLRLQILNEPARLQAQRAKIRHPAAQLQQEQHVEALKDGGGGLQAGRRAGKGWCEAGAGGVRGSRAAGGKRGCHASRCERWRPASTSRPCAGPPGAHLMYGAHHGAVGACHILYGAHDNGSGARIQAGGGLAAAGGSSGRVAGSMFWHQQFSSTPAMQEGVRRQAAGSSRKATKLSPPAWTPGWNIRQQHNLAGQCIG